MTNWIADAQRPIAMIAAELGMDGHRDHYPCPARCQGGDPRPAFSTSNKWGCYRCGIKGDAVDYVSYALTGKRFGEAQSEERATVKAWFFPGSAARPEPRLPPAPIPTAPPRTYVDPSAFWLTCARPAPSDRWLTSRGIDPTAVAAHDLARYTPDIPTDEWPEWWPRSRAITWRLVTRGWTAEGDAANLHGRAVGTLPPPHDGKAAPKTLWAKGVSSGGLLFWNRIRPAANPQETPAVLIAEGMPDWLTAAVWGSPRRIPVYGATSGGFSSLSRVGIHPGTAVYAMVHEDAAGDKYLQSIIEALPENRILRVRPSKLAPPQTLQQAAK